MDLTMMIMTLYFTANRYVIPKDDGLRSMLEPVPDRHYLPYFKAPSQRFYNSEKQQMQRVQHKI